MVNPAGPDSSSRRRVAKACACLLALAAASLAGCQDGGRLPSLNAGDWLVGAYYHTWYPKSLHRGRRLTAEKPAAARARVGRGD